MDIEMRLVYAGLPPVKNKNTATKVVALMNRALFLQEHKSSMEKFNDMVKEIDYEALKEMARELDTTAEDILFDYFSHIGYKKEFQVMTLENATDLINALT